MKNRLRTEIIKKVIKNILNTVTYRIKMKFRHGDLRDIKSILFLCYGNICRSPYCEYYMKNKLVKRKAQIQSAGFFEKEQRPAAKNAILAAKIMGVDLTEHRSKKITADMVKNSSIIIGMHYLHYWRFKNEFPQDVKKFFLLKEFGGNAITLLNIDDPYGKSIETFVGTFNIIDRCINHIADRMN